MFASLSGMSRAIALCVVAAALPAQAGPIFPFNLDLNGNRFDVLPDWNGSPALLIYNPVPRVNGQPAHHLANFYPPALSLLPVQLNVEVLLFFEPNSCAWNRDVELGATVQAGTPWRGTVGPTGLTVHGNVGVPLAWPAVPPPGASSVPAGSLIYDTSTGPLVGCSPAATPLSPGFFAICTFAVAPPQPTANIVQFAGMETGDASEFSFVSSTVSVQSAVARSGGFAMRSTTNTGEYGYATIKRDDVAAMPDGDLGLVDTFLLFHFRYAASSGRVRIAEVTGTSATKARLEIEPSGVLSVEDASATRYIGSTVLVPDQWYRIGMRVGSGPATRLELLVDGNVEVAVADASCSDQIAARVHLGRSARNGGFADYFYDDVQIADNALPTDGRVRLLRPNAVGSHVGWNGSFNAVADWPHDGDASVNDSLGQGTAVTHALQDTAALGIGGAVLAVRPVAAVRRMVGSYTASALRWRSGGVDTDSAPGDGGSAFHLRARVLTLDPATGRAWTLTGVDGLEVGLMHQQSQATRQTRTTSVGAMVLSTQ